MTKQKVKRKANVYVRMPVLGKRESVGSGNAGFMCLKVNTLKYKVIAGANY